MKAKDKFEAVVVSRDHARTNGENYKHAVVVVGEAEVKRKQILDQEVLQVRV